jgi:hypothetical protein
LQIYAYPTLTIYKAGSNEAVQYRGNVRSVEAFKAFLVETDGYDIRMTFSVSVSVSVLDLVSVSVSVLSLVSVSVLVLELISCFGFDFGFGFGFDFGIGFGIDFGFGFGFGFGFCFGFGIDFVFWF